MCSVSVICISPCQRGEVSCSRVAPFEPSRQLNLSAVPQAGGKGKWSTKVVTLYTFFSWEAPLSVAAERTAVCGWACTSCWWPSREAEAPLLWCLEQTEDSVMNASSGLTPPSRVSSLNTGECSLMLVHNTFLPLHYLLPLLHPVLLFSNLAFSKSHFWTVQQKISGRFMHASCRFHGHLIQSAVAETSPRKTSRLTGNTSPGKYTYQFDGAPL